MPETQRLAPGTATRNPHIPQLSTSEAVCVAQDFPPSAQSVKPGEHADTLQFSSALPPTQIHPATLPPSTRAPHWLGHAGDTFDDEECAIDVEEDAANALLL